LLQEFKFHKKTGSDINRIRSLRYEQEFISSINDIGEKDSAVFILMVAKKYATWSGNEEQDFSKENVMSVKEMKEGMLRMILENGERIT
jgi:hypothetical protein